MSTIGYGDVANPSSSTERTVACIAMAAGSIFWAYIIANVVNMVDALNVDASTFHAKMDELNDFMIANRLPVDLRTRLRDYFYQRRTLLVTENNRLLLADMSPSLRGEVAEVTARKWLKFVPWLKWGSKNFRTSVALALQPHLYSPKEIVSAEHFHIITRGVVVKDLRILISGDVWGVDMILSDPTLRYLQPARCLAYVRGRKRHTCVCRGGGGVGAVRVCFAWCVLLPSLFFSRADLALFLPLPYVCLLSTRYVQVLNLLHEDFENLLDNFPKERKKVRAAGIWMAFRRKFLMHAREVAAVSDAICACVRKGFAEGRDPRKLFKEADEDGNGELSHAELRECLRKIGFNPSGPVFTNLVRRLDADGSGNVSYDEFIDMFCEDGDVFVAEYEGRTKGVRGTSMEVTAPLVPCKGTSSSRQLVRRRSTSRQISRHHSEHGEVVAEAKVTFGEVVDEVVHHSASGGQSSQTQKMMREMQKMMRAEVGKASAMMIENMRAVLYDHDHGEGAFEALKEAKATPQKNKSRKEHQSESTQRAAAKEDDIVI